MITADKVFSKLEEFHDFIDEMAESKAKMEFLENQSKSVKAALMLKSGLTSNAAQETWALAHQEYLDHLKAVSHEVGKYEHYKLRKDYAFALLEGWRTLESSKRAMGNFR